MLRAVGKVGRIIPEPLIHTTASWSDVLVSGERGPWSPSAVPPAPNQYPVQEVSLGYRLKHRLGTVVLQRFSTLFGFRWPE